jgi:hypothetical protein
LCDISEPNDGVIDELDLAMFCTRWLKCYTGEPPQPDPMQWQLQPLAISDSSIFMEAVEASDPCGVQYYFQCVDGNCNDSGWHDSRVYEDTNLMPETAYTYRVITRDNSFRQNAGAWSVIKTDDSFA